MGKTHLSSPLTEAYCSVFSDILSQSITGELIGMQNFATMVGIVDDVEEKMEAAEHADNERGHAVAFQRAAEELGVDVIVDINAPYWKRIREAFLKWADKGDVIACFIIQEVMLESFAVSMYDAVAKIAHDPLKTLYERISAEEEEHLEHAVELLQAELARDQDGFTEKVHRIHEDVMTVLAEMVAREDLRGHCGICHGNCMKESLHHVDLDIVNLRGQALNFYLKSLDRIGLPGDTTLSWVANLPV